MEQPHPIATALDIRLPLVYLAMLETYPLPRHDSCLLNDPKNIIELTNEYRTGYEGAPPWPKSWLYLGDSNDACPVILDTENGRVKKTDHGNHDYRPLQEWDSLWQYINDCLGLFY